MHLRGTEAMSYERFMTIDPLFGSYEEFIDHIDLSL